MDVRRGRPADADAIADAFIPSFESLVFLPMLHTHEEHRTQGEVRGDDAVCLPPVGRGTERIQVGG